MKKQQMLGALLVFVAVLLAGCAPTLSNGQAIRLAAEVRPLLDARCGKSGMVSPVDWPFAVLDQKPKSVRIRADGLYVTTSTFLVDERGLFVPCRPEEFKPTTNTDPSFETIGNGVYSFHIAG